MGAPADGEVAGSARRDAVDPASGNRAGGRGVLRSVTNTTTNVIQAARDSGKTENDKHGHIGAFFRYANSVAQGVKFMGMGTGSAGTELAGAAASLVVNATAAGYAIKNMAENRNKDNVIAAAAAMTAAVSDVFVGAAAVAEKAGVDSQTVSSVKLTAGVVGMLSAQVAVGSMDRQTVGTRHILQFAERIAESVGWKSPATAAGGGPASTTATNPASSPATTRPTSPPPQTQSSAGGFAAGASATTAPVAKTTATPSAGAQEFGMIRRATTFKTNSTQPAPSR
jgi:hypothetical protein